MVKKDIFIGGRMVEESKLLNNVDPEEYFILKNGRVLKNIYELTNSLTSMDDETFKYHVNKEKNDFANWIRHVFKDEKLANQIFRLKTKEFIIKRINKKLSKFNEEFKNKDRRTKQEIQKFDVAKAKVDFSKAEERIKKIDFDKEVLSKVDEVLLKEKEIVKREEKIQEIEDRIERQLAERKGEINKEEKFFSKEFVQGIVTGFLITLIGGLIYIKFFY